MKEKYIDYCLWLFVDDLYNTSCGEKPLFVFDNPIDAGFKYCPFCGGKIIDKKY